MILVSVLALADSGLRLFAYGDSGHTNGLLVVLSLLSAGLVSLGALYGGALVYEYGFNVETAGDHPVWHVSEEDVFSGSQPTS
jgi:uncharacterized membrane protein